MAGNSHGAGGGLGVSKCVQGETSESGVGEVYQLQCERPVYGETV